MNRKTVTFHEIHEEYCDFIDACAKFSCFTRSEEIQKEKVAECKNYLEVIRAYKCQAVNKGDCDRANEFFHMQCMINSMHSFLLMWINLKTGDYSKSWSNLVDSQEYASVARRIHNYEGVQNLENRLNSAEIAIFPGWSVYNSPGFLETIGKCSVCNLSFYECDHIENKIYSGKLCQRVDREIIKADHFALVKEPRDRRCIITKISDDNGNELDYFTWEKTGKRTDPEDGMHLEGVMFSIPTLDFS